MPSGHTPEGAVIVGNARTSQRMVFFEDRSALTIGNFSSSTDLFSWPPWATTILFAPLL